MIRIAQVNIELHRCVAAIECKYDFTDVKIENRFKEKKMKSGIMKLCVICSNLMNSEW